MLNLQGVLGFRFVWDHLAEPVDRFTSWRVIDFGGFQDDKISSDTTRSTSKQFGILSKVFGRFADVVRLSSL
jgi:hypothetical protein